jgi:hypothetical protein
LKLFVVVFRFILLFDFILVESVYFARLYKKIKTPENDIKDIFLKSIKIKSNIFEGTM